MRASRGLKWENKMYKLKSSIASIAWVLQSSSGNTNKAVGEVNFRLKEFLLRLLTKLTFSHRWVS